jgi:hypothetical protein
LAFRGGLVESDMPRNRNPRPRQPSEPRVLPPPALLPLLKDYIRSLYSLEEDDLRHYLHSLEFSSGIEEYQTRLLLLEWLADPRQLPKMFDGQRVAFYARLVHAFYLHRQLRLAPPPGGLPWPDEAQLSDSQWIWLLVDSWSFENSMWIKYWMWSHRPPDDAVYWA